MGQGPGSKSWLSSVNQGWEQKYLHPWVTGRLTRAARLKAAESSARPFVSAARLSAIIFRTRFTARKGPLSPAISVLPPPTLKGGHYYPHRSEKETAAERSTGRAHTAGTTSPNCQWSFRLFLLAPDSSYGDTSNGESDRAQASPQLLMPPWAVLTPALNNPIAHLTSHCRPWALPPNLFLLPTSRRATL